MNDGRLPTAHASHPFGLVLPVGVRRCDLSACDDRVVPIDDVRVVLRALAEVRDKEFYPLWVLLTRSWAQPVPRIEFRIFQVAEGLDVRLVVHVCGTRPDGAELDWGIAVMTRPFGLLVEGSIDMRAPGQHGSEVFCKSHEASDPQEAADLIRSTASEVCRQRRWVTEG
jgi:hypothetical protein